MVACKDGKRRFRVPVWLYKKPVFPAAERMVIRELAVDHQLCKAETKKERRTSARL
jgi:hypothetical protein